MTPLPMSTVLRLQNTELTARLQAGVSSELRFFLCLPAGRYLWWDLKGVMQSCGETKNQALRMTLKDTVLEQATRVMPASFNPILLLWCTHHPYASGYGNRNSKPSGSF